MDDAKEIVWVEDFLDDKRVTLEVDGVEVGHVERVNDTDWSFNLAGQNQILGVRPDQRSAQTALMRIVRAAE